MAANTVPKNSVWSAMKYQPPRGRCNYKTNILSSCPCLRFMLHPVKAATSFDCDGCGHHASFHNLENKEEDAVLSKWAETAAITEQQQASAGANKKRRRIADKPAEAFQILELDDNNEPIPAVLASSTRRPNRKRPARTVTESP